MISLPHAIVRFLGGVLGSRDLIFLKVYPKRENLGDLLLSQLLLKELRKYGVIRVNERALMPEARVAIGLLDGEVWGLERHVFELAILAISLARRLFGRRTYFFGSPGHAFSRAAAPAKAATFAERMRRFLSGRSGLRRCRLGISAGPLSEEAVARLRREAKLMYHFSVRETVSRDYLAVNGIANVGTIPDLAWLVPTSGGHGERDSLLFSFRDSILGSLDGFYGSSTNRNRLFSILEKVASAHPNRKVIVAYQVERDRDFCHQLAESLRSSRAEVKIVDRMLDLNSATALYARAEKVFSNRLHVLMLAFSQGALPIAVIDSLRHTKVRGVFELASLGHLVWDLDSTNPEEALARSLPIPGGHVPVFEANRSKVVEEIAKIFS